MSFGDREPIDPVIREECYHKFSGHCAYCGVQLGSKGWHVDHVIPVAKGGPEDIVNFFPSCKHCNTLKNAYTLEQFRTCIEDYHLKAGVVISERFGILQVIAPMKVVFHFEKQGYTFPEELVKSMMEIND